jgi:hypothetical protein
MTLIRRAKMMCGRHGKTPFEPFRAVLVVLKRKLLSPRKIQNLQQKRQPWTLGQKSVEPVGLEKV